MAAASDSSPTEAMPFSPAGAMRLPTVRTSKRSPGSVPRRRLETTRLSEHVRRSATGFCP